MSRKRKRPRKVAVKQAPSRLPWPLPLLLVALAFGIHARSLGAPFHFDDWAFIVSEPWVRQLWPIEGHPNRPVLSFSLALSHAVFGMEPFGFRLGNVAIHAAAGLFLFGATRRILQARSTDLGIRPNGFAFGVAALWIVHPLHTHAVTYIWQRSESMMGMFFFAAIYALARAARAGSAHRTWCGLVLAACLMGLGTKEVMVAVFPVLLLIDGLLLSPSLRSALRRRWLLYAAFAAITLALLVFVLPRTSTSTGELSRAEYALSQPGIVLRYLRLAVFPYPLCFDYGLGPAQGAGIWAPSIGVAGILLATAWALWRRSWVGAAAAFSILALAPSSSVVPVNDLMAEYRMYVPLAGLAVLAVGGLRALSTRTPLPLGVLLGSLVLGLGFASIRRNAVYLRQEKLWSRTVEVAPLNPRAHLFHGLAHLSEGRVFQAERALRKALALDPLNVTVRRNLALVLRGQGRPAESLEHYRVVVDRSSTAGNHTLFGDALLHADDLEGAVTQFGLALERDPKHLEALKGRARARARLDRTEGALRDARRATRVAADDLASWRLVAELCVRLGRSTKAVEAYGNALELDPEDAGLLFDLAAVHVDAGNGREAVELVERSLGLEHRRARSASELALRAARAWKGDGRDSAREIGRLAVEASRRRDVEVLANLARVHVVQGAIGPARELFEEAMRLDHGPQHAAARVELRRELAALGR